MCTPTEITVKMIEDYVEPLLLEHLQKELTKALFTEEENPDSAKLNQLNIELIKINQEIDNLVDAVASAGPAAAKRYNAKIEKLDKASERISQEILALKRDRRKFCVIDNPRQYENLRLSQE